MIGSQRHIWAVKWLHTENMGCSREPDMMIRDRRGPSFAVPRTNSSVVEGLLNYADTDQSKILLVDFI